MSTHALELGSHDDVLDDHHDARTPQPCTNCGAEGAVVFCPQCGEPQPAHHDYSLGHVIGHGFHELFHLDAKIVTTLRLLLTRPGALTVDYFAGRKTRYVTPLRLCLTLFACFFFAYTAYKPLALSCELVVKQNPKVFNDLFDRVAAKRHMTREQLEDKIDHQWQHAISLLQLGNILIVGVVLALVLVGSGRWFAEHLVFGAHYMSFTYIVSLVSWPYRYWFGVAPGPANTVLQVVTLALTFVYLHVAMKRVYGTGIFSTFFAFLGISVGSALLITMPFFIALASVAMH